MILNELTLRNFAKHKQKKITFKPGINGIVGENGTGKSSIIEGIQFALTGEAGLAKSELITTGTSSGYVWCSFEIEGKQGTIERRLDASKVILEYDGNKLTKATEVKELWNKLFQIDHSIFNNVIIAHQNQIPLLFSGDNAMREKIFQKIFMVPPTEKTRKLIWDSYINKCPPPLPEDNLVELKKRLIENSHQLNNLEKDVDLAKSAVMDDSQVGSVLQRVNYIQNCKKDAAARPTIESQLETLRDRLTFLQENRDKQIDKLGCIDVERFLKMQEDLVEKRTVSNMVKSLTSQITQLTNEFKLTHTEYTELKTAYSEAVEKLLALQSKGLEMSFQIKALKDKLNKLYELDSREACPTCLQNLNEEETKKKQQSLSNELQVLEAEQLLLRTSIDNLQTISNTNESSISYHEGLVTKKEQLETRLKEYGDVEYSEEDYNLVQEILSNYRALQASVSEQRQEISSVQNELNLKQQQLTNLTVYVRGVDDDDIVTMDEELEVMQEAITVNSQKKQKLDGLLFEKIRIDSQINLLVEQIEQTEINKLKNQQRKSYLDGLHKVYDLLHTSCIPRKLIESYATVVEEELAAQLDNFAIPYRACVGEGFRIDMFNEDGCKVPKVSGGEELIVGLCLRLALHNMFSQSFPMLIIDEGTTNLSTANVKLYFDFIKQLKTNTKIKQMIIIDHRQELMNVVDNVIQL